MEDVIQVKTTSVINTEALRGVKYQTLLWLFVTGSVLGFVIEGLWQIVLTGEWLNHAATIWGPFCISYGVGAVGAYVISLCFSGRHILLQFAVCSLSGGAVEYFASLFQETVFGSVSWNYTDHFLNLNGRVSLQMAVAWGAMGVLFIRLLFPYISRALGMINHKKSALLCRAVTVFLAVNLMVTAIVVLRWEERSKSIPPSGKIEQAIDYIYTDEKLVSIFSNMNFLKTR